MSSFSGLNIALSGLRAQQAAMNITAHNIANADTPGYHRQEVSLAPGIPVSGGISTVGSNTPQIGTGVLIDGITRLQSDYVDGQLRTANQSLGSWSFKNDTLKQVESVLGEPGDLGLSSFIDRFWNAWGDLANSPSSSSRQAVVEEGKSLANKIQSLYSDLSSVRQETDKDVRDSVSQINTIATEIGHLNEQIRQTSVDSASDLLDRRDLLLDNLSKLVNINVDGVQGSELIVNINGKPLVQGTEVTKIVTTPGPTGFSQPTWEDDDSPVGITGGQIAGQIEFRDVNLSGYIDSLNQVASILASRVNELHSTGVTPSGDPAGNFFLEDADASNISVVATSDSVVNSTSIGNDNRLANDIWAIQDEKLLDNMTIGDAYNTIVTRIGSDSREAQSRSDIYQSSVNQLNSQKDSVSGVSIDEEMSNLVKFQQAYNASARVFSVVDEMISLVINNLGAGR